MLTFLRLIVIRASISVKNYFPRFWEFFHKPSPKGATPHIVTLLVESLPSDWRAKSATPHYEKFLLPGNTSRGSSIPFVDSPALLSYGLNRSSLTFPPHIERKVLLGDGKSLDKWDKKGILETIRIPSRGGWIEEDGQR